MADRPIIPEIVQRIGNVIRRSGVNFDIIDISEKKRATWSGTCLFLNKRSKFEVTSLRSAALPKASARTPHMLVTDQRGEIIYSDYVKL